MHATRRMAQPRSGRANARLQHNNANSAVKPTTLIPLCSSKGKPKTQHHDPTSTAISEAEDTIFDTLFKATSPTDNTTEKPSC